MTLFYDIYTQTAQMSKRRLKDIQRTSYVLKSSLRCISEICAVRISHLALEVFPKLCYGKKRERKGEEESESAGENSLINMFSSESIYFMLPAVCSLSRKLERGNFSHLEALRPRPRFRVLDLHFPRSAG